jgi:hypothetical protein
MCKNGSKWGLKNGDNTNEFSDVKKNKIKIDKKHNHPEEDAIALCELLPLFSRTFEIRLVAIQHRGMFFLHELGESHYLKFLLPQVRLRYMLYTSMNP